MNGTVLLLQSSLEQLRPPSPSVKSVWAFSLSLSLPGACSGVSHSGGWAAVAVDGGLSLVGDWRFSRKIQGAHRQVRWLVGGGIRQLRGSNREPVPG